MIVQYHNARLVDAMGDRFGDLYAEYGVIRYCAKGQSSAAMCSLICAAAC